MTTTDKQENVKSTPAPTVDADNSDMPSKRNEKELDNYRQTVERLAELDSSEVFSNGRPEHAAIIFSTFLKHAKDRVVIFCQNLSREVFDDPCVLSNLESALDRKVKVEILTQESPAATNFLAKEKSWKEQGLPISLKTAAKGSPVAEVNANFAVADGKAYRFEPKRVKVEAFACMNNPEAAADLVNLFGKMYRAVA